MVEARGLVRHYGERTVLAGVDLDVPAGATLAVFGENGAGKTTLLRILGGLLRAHEGTVSVLGEPLPDHGHKVRGRVGFLGHDPLLYRDLSPRENLRYHARLHGIPAERVEERLAAVGMDRRGDDPVHALSRGMAQRVAIARATLHAPEVLLLDEPYANLDPDAVALVKPLLTGPTRVLVSHDVAAARAEADHAIRLARGAAVPA